MTDMAKVGLPAKKTKIVCTIGPASQSPEVLEKMIAAGMNVARINFAHGDVEGHRQVIANVRAAAAAVGRRVAIMGDLPGPKIRIGPLAQEPIELLAGQTIVLESGEETGDEQRVSVSFPELARAVKPGDQIFINDGFIQLTVESIAAGAVTCRVMVGGELRSHKGVNLPNADLGISAFTERDRFFLEFAADQALDAISQSFVQDAADIQTVREAARALNYDPMIIAKIERASAVDNIEEILPIADGIMVARGDLGVETPIECVAVIQKKLISTANRFSRPVITATHMLESMTDNRRPTRAEATDVANAIIDGTDCVMLSGETAVGRFPVEAVSVMARIAAVTEDEQHDQVVAKLLQLDRERGNISRDDLVSLSIFLSVEALSPAVVFAPTSSGATARRLSRFRLPTWIVGISDNESTCQRLQFSYGVHPVYEPSQPPRWTPYVRRWVQQLDQGGDLAILTEGTRRLSPGGFKRIEIIDLGKAS